MDVIINGTKFVPEPDHAATAPTLAVLLLRARKNARYTLRQAAIKAGVNYSTAWAAECSSTPSLLTVCKLARLYGLSMEAVATTVIGGKK